MTELVREDKLRILAAALEAEDIRPILAAEKLKRQKLVNLAHHALDDCIITTEEFDRIAKSIEKPKIFPTNHEQRLEAILSGVVNTEHKQILTLLLQDNPQSLVQLKEDFVEATNSVWTPRRLTTYIESYLLLSLDSVGFVAHPVLRDLNIGVKATEAGKKYGQPLAAFALDIGRQIDFSFHQLLGSTCSHGDSRAPYNRFRILHFLLDGDTRISELRGQLNLPHIDVVSHLKTLKELGFVEFDSVGSEQRGWAVYKWSGDKPEDVKTVGGRPTLTRAVAQHLFKNGEADRNQIAADLKTGEYRDCTNAYLRADISRILVGLKRQGVASSGFHGNDKSHVKLLKDKTEFVDEFTRKVNGALRDGPELQEMERLNQLYQNDPDRLKTDATRRLGIYVSVSPQINCRSAEEWLKDVLLYISSRGEVRPRDIASGVGKGARNYLPSMVNGDLLIKKRRGHTTIYMINPDYRPS